VGESTDSAPNGNAGARQSAPVTSGGRAASLANLRPPWKPGDPSPNKAGRPKKKKIVQMLEEELDAMAEKVGLAEGARLVARKMAQMMIKDGHYGIIQDYQNRRDGLVKATGGEEEGAKELLAGMWAKYGRGARQIPGGLGAAQDAPGGDDGSGLGDERGFGADGSQGPEDGPRDVEIESQAPVDPLGSLTEVIDVAGSELPLAQDPEDAEFRAIDTPVLGSSMVDAAGDADPEEEVVDDGLGYVGPIEGSAFPDLGFAVPPPPAPDYEDEGGAEFI
jgi:hypothetical protein